jgi:hypothetical protein
MRVLPLQIYALRTCSMTLCHVVRQLCRGHPLWGLLLVALPYMAQASAAGERGVSAIYSAPMLNMVTTDITPRTAAMCVPL